MVTINLLPKEIIAKQRMRDLLFIVGTVCGIAVGLSGAFYIAKVNEHSYLTSEKKKIEKELQALLPVVQEVKALTESEKLLIARKDLVERLLGVGLVYPRFLADLIGGGILPDGVWFTSMNTAASRTAERTIASIKVNLSCNSYDKFVIADFLGNLENPPASYTGGRFSNVTLGPIAVSVQGPYELHTFTISFDYLVPKAVLQ